MPEAKELTQLSQKVKNTWLEFLYQYEANNL